MNPKIHIHLNTQTLDLIQGDRVITYSVSTAKNGSGQNEGSYCTPLGSHIVKEKIGYNQDLNTIYKARTQQTALYDPATTTTDEDLILSRILWLSGTEPQLNRLGTVDTKNRYIYIHGTHEESLIGTPSSHGCIRMKRKDVVELFDLVPLYTQVLISQE